MSTDDTPFADLPAALLEEMLGRTTDVGNVLLGTFRDLRADRRARRESLVERDLILHESSLGYPPLPTMCAADGSYAIERLLTVDLAAAAAVAVEGLTPPSEKRFWNEPRHSTFVMAEVHHAETRTILQAIMLGMELLLATQAPHDVVLLDGAWSALVAELNVALHAAVGAPGLRCAEGFLAGYPDYLAAYLEVLRSERTDKSYAAVPKYSSRREIGSAAGWPQQHDDRGLLTLLLEAGELTRPVPLEQPAHPWVVRSDGLPVEVARGVDAIAADVVESLRTIHVFYYKPHQWLPALRIEVARNIAVNTHRLATLVQGIKHQCATTAMLEPYPLYLADRTVKSIARAIPAFRQVTTQRISERYEGDIAEVFFAMHGYRSETGA